MTDLLPVDREGVKVLHFPEAARRFWGGMKTGLSDGAGWGRVAILLTTGRLETGLGSWCRLHITFAQSASTSSVCLALC